MYARNNDDTVSANKRLNNAAMSSKGRDRKRRTLVAAPPSKYRRLRESREVRYLLSSLTSSERRKLDSLVREFVSQYKLKTQMLQSPSTATGTQAVQVSKPTDEEIRYVRDIMTGKVRAKSFNVISTVTLDPEAEKEAVRALMRGEEPPLRSGTFEELLQSKQYRITEVSDSD